MDSFYFLFSSQHSLVTRCWGYRAKSDRAPRVVPVSFHLALGRISTETGV